MLSTSCLGLRNQISFYFLAYLQNLLFFFFQLLTTFVRLCLHKQNLKASGEISRPVLAQTDLRIFPNHWRLLLSGYQITASLMPGKPTQRGVCHSSPGSSCSDISLCPMQPSPWAFFSSAGASFLWPHVGPISAYMEGCGSSKEFPFGLDQPLFLVSLLLELPSEEGREGYKLLSLFGKLWGLSGRPRKDKISKCNGIQKWMGKL